MKTMRLNSFLFCFQLETGGLIIGWIGIISCLIGALLSILMVVGLAAGMMDMKYWQEMGYTREGELDQNDLDVIRNGSLEIFEI